MTPKISLIMPTFRQAAFISRAIDSLIAQTRADWELIIIVDGPLDESCAIIERYLLTQSPANGRVQPPVIGANCGLGAAINQGLERARGELIAYLPSDDILDPNHLEELAKVLENDDAILAFSGARHHRNRQSDGQIDGYVLQMVQVMHRRTAQRWVTRDELTTDDLDRMFWHKLRPEGEFVGTENVSCEWFDHLHQRHKVIREDLAKESQPYLTSGLNAYRARYEASQPLIFQSSMGNLIDEVALYRPFRERPATPRQPDGLKILLVGELAFNPERVLALEERGHELFGLWMPNPGSFNFVGPQPFSHIKDISRTNWPVEVAKIQPDVIYGLLNFRAVPFAHQVLTNCDVPFVWHLKEGPIHCRDKGTWRQLVDLHTRSQGQIYSSDELRDWFFDQVPATRDGLSMVLDGDLPKRDWLDCPISPRLSDLDGEIHTVLAGRPMGLSPEIVGELAQNGVHLHFYGAMTGHWQHWFDLCRAAAPHHLHQHRAVAQDEWVTELTKYDAAWLHVFEAKNEGDIRRANWDDLNIPARFATYAVAGLPLIQFDNAGAIFASDALARGRNMSLFWKNIPQLCSQLNDKSLMRELQESVWRQREEFAFDFHAERLEQFFRQAMARSTQTSVKM